MQEKIVIWIFLICVILSSIFDIFLGLTHADRNQALKTNYDEIDVLKGIIWVVAGILMIFS